MPTTNSFFSSTTGYTGEQSLVDSLVIEQIGMFGVDLLYMPRENINLDRLLHESTKDVFSIALSIPMYIKSFDGYDNSIEILSVQFLCLNCVIFLERPAISYMRGASCNSVDTRMCIDAYLKLLGSLFGSRHHVCANS